ISLRSLSSNRSTTVREVRFKMQSLAPANACRNWCSVRRGFRGFVPHGSFFLRQALQQPEGSGHQAVFARNHVGSQIHRLQFFEKTARNEQECSPVTSSRSAPFVRRARRFCPHQSRCDSAPELLTEVVPTC